MRGVNLLASARASKEETANGDEGEMVEGVNGEEAIVDAAAVDWDEDELLEQEEEAWGEEEEEVNGEEAATDGEEEEL